MEAGNHAGSATSVVVLTYNSASTIEKCLLSVLPELEKNDELIVVDNASADDTVARVQSLGLRPIQNALNLGFSAGVNVGLRAAKGNYMLVLNPDTVLRKGCLQGLRARFVDPEVGAVGPVSNFAAALQYVGHHLPADLQLGMSHDELHALLSQTMAGRSMLTRLLIGFCVMFRREALERVGLFDEDLFLGSDDLEICWRLQIQGYRLVIARDVYVEHKGGVSFASEPDDRIKALLDESTVVLQEKLRRFYAPEPVPSSRDLWGCDIFPG